MPPPAFLTLEEAALTGLFLARQQDLFTTEPAFGPAGGPDRPIVSEAGRVRAFAIASLYRLNLQAEHIEALSVIASYGDAGMPLRNTPPALYSPARALADLRITDRYQESLAAALDGDEARYKQITDENRLVWLDQTAGPPHLDVWRLTSTGRALLESGAEVEKSMISHLGQ